MSMRVLIACEFSGIVREAFKAKGHDVWSCDLLPTEIPGQHIQRNVLDVLNAGWDLMIAHPPCTYTSKAGYRWFKSQPDRMNKAVQGYNFFLQLAFADIPKIAVENTKGLLQKWYGEPNQIIHPYMFGEPVQKATCLWLKNLPVLHSTNMLSNYEINWTKNGKNNHRGKERSITFQSIANAMADQWG